MKSNRYFAEQVLRKRPYLSTRLIAAVPESPVRQVVQADGRVRYWGRVIDARNGQQRTRAA